LAQVEIQSGLTGKVAFDDNGQRRDYTLEVHQMGYKSKLKKVGSMVNLQLGTVVVVIVW